MLIKIIDIKKFSARECYYSRHGDLVMKGWVDLERSTQLSKLQDGDILEAREIGRRKTKDGFSSVAVVEPTEYPVVSQEITVDFGSTERAKIRTRRKTSSWSVSRDEEFSLDRAIEILGDEYVSAKEAGHYSVSADL